MKATDKQRVLRALQHGPVVVTDWTGPTTPDGGKPVLRLAARICELRDEGHQIEVVGRRNHCAVYALRHQEAA